MVFSSALFLSIFLPVFLLIYVLSPQKAKNWTALVGSTFFYAWGAPLFVFVVFASMWVDYWMVDRISKGKNRKTMVALSVMLNVGLLAYFKYSNFFVENLNSILNTAGIEIINWTSVALPIGISFFTFQKLSYVIDVYRGKHSSLSNFSDYALYIILFPQLIAGPIVRFSEIADQLVNREERENIDNRLLGFFRFCIGLAKKVLVANVVGEVADTAFALPYDQISLSWSWIGIVAYTFQIYFDFSGYSDMAIGLGRMMGFVFPENFNNPYVSRSITEFWQRWHMTLSRWMKDYLYIPLGGNRKGSGRTYFNLWTVFLFSGLWHGASWTFVIWGAYHGFFLVTERLFLGKLYQKIGKIPSTLITFLLAMIGWVIFRADNMNHATAYLHGMFAMNSAWHLPSLSLEFYFFISLAVVGSFSTIIPQVEPIQDRILLNTDVSIFTRIAKLLISIFLFVFCLSMIVSSGFNPFIYFRF